MPVSEMPDRDTLLAQTADIVSAHVAHNVVSITDLPDLMGSVHAAMAGLGVIASEKTVELKSAVSVKSSIKPDYIVCLEDGVKRKMLKRHLRTHHGLTPEAYRARWKLPADYPMVAPNYSETRKALALTSKLGCKKSGDNQVAKGHASSTVRSGVRAAGPVKKAPAGSPSRRKLGISIKDGGPDPLSGD